MKIYFLILVKRQPHIMKGVINMTKEMFIKCMEKIKNKDKEIDDFMYGIDKAFGEVPEKLTEITSINYVIEMLEDIMGDVNKFISWYIYDKDWGKRKDLNVYTEDGWEIPCNSFEELYEIIEGSVGPN